MMLMKPSPDYHIAHSETQAGLELMAILMPQLPGGLDYKHELAIQCSTNVHLIPTVCQFLLCTMYNSRYLKIDHQTK